MSEFTMNQLYIQLKTTFYTMILILIPIIFILIVYIIYSSLKSKDSQNKEDTLLNDILYAIYGQKTVDTNKIDQTLNRLYSEKQFYQKLYITFFRYSFVTVNIFFGIFSAIYTKLPLLKEYYFSFALLASVVLYFIYVYMDNISVQINNQSIAIKYLENKLCMNIQSFSFNGYYKSSSNILTDRSILQYIVIFFASIWIIAGTIISAKEGDLYENLFLSIGALLTFPVLMIMERYAKNKKKSMIEEIRNKYKIKNKNKK